jgi:hypothetical protein
MSYTHFTVSYPETGLALITLTPACDSSFPARTFASWLSSLTISKPSQN